MDEEEEEEAAAIFYETKIMPSCLFFFRGKAAAALNAYDIHTQTHEIIYPFYTPYLEVPPLLFLFLLFLLLRARLVHGIDWLSDDDDDDGHEWPLFLLLNVWLERSVFLDSCD